MNIVSLIMQYLGPAIVAKLAGSFGINSTIAQKAIAAAIPAILGGLVGKASQPNGAGAIMDILGKMDPNILGKLGGLIGGAEQAKVAEQGSSALGSLLGGSGLGALTGALGKFTGAPDTATKGMLGMLAPIVLGTLGQQQKSAGLDAGGLAKLLMGQKDNISAAMPKDFAKLLGGSGLLDGVSGTGSAAGMAQQATAAASSAAGSATRAAQNVGSAASSAASSAAGSAMRTASSMGVTASGFKWWPWALAAVAAAVLWWGYGMLSAPGRIALPEVPKITVGSTDVGAQLAGSIGSLPAILASVKDAGSATAALPKLKEASDRLESINGMMDKFSPDAKKALAGYATAALPSLTPALKDTLNVPGASGILKVVIDQILARITAFAKA